MLSKDDTRPRSQGEIAHPGADFSAQLKTFRAFKKPADRLKYLSTSSLIGAATIGLGASGDAKIRKIRNAIAAIVKGASGDQIGRTIGGGIGYLPMPCHPNARTCYYLNSDVLTAEDLRRAEQTEAVGGATIRIPIQLKNSTTDGYGPAREHADLLVFPNGARDGKPFFITSLADPFDHRHNSQAMLDFITVNALPTLPSSIFEKALFPDDTRWRLGHRTLSLTGDLESEQALLFENFMRSKFPAICPYYTAAMLSVKINRAEFSEILKNRAIMLTSWQKDAPVTAGIRGHGNSTIHDAGRATDHSVAGARRSTQQIIEEYASRAVAIHFTRSTEKRIADFLDDLDPEIEKISTEYFRAWYSSVHQAGRGTHLVSDIRSASFCEAFNNVNAKHPERGAQRFYKEAVDVVHHHLISLPEFARGMRMSG